MIKEFIWFGYAKDIAVSVGIVALVHLPVKLKQLMVCVLCYVLNQTARASVLCMILVIYIGIMLVGYGLPIPQI